MATIQYITDKDFFKNNLKYNALAIVECFSSLSGMQIMEPVLVKFKELINHFRINTDTFPFISVLFYIICKSAYVIFHKGELIDGMVPFYEFPGILESHLEYLKRKLKSSYKH